MVKKLSTEDIRAERAIRKSEGLRKAEAERLKARLAEIEKIKKAEQETKKKESDVASQLKELANKLLLAEKEIIAGRPAGAFCMLVVKQAVVLQIEEIKAVIQKAEEKLVSLQHCLKIVPESDELGNIVNEYNSFGAVACKKCEELIKNIKNISTVDGNTLINNIKYITGQIAETLKNKSTFGYDLLAAVKQNEVIVYSEQARVLFRDLQNRLNTLSGVLEGESEHLAETPNEFDDNLIVLYNALVDYVGIFTEKLETTATTDVASSKLELTKMAQELKDNYAYVEKTKKLIDTICIQYIDILTYIDAQEKAFAIVLPDAENQKLRDIDIEYEEIIEDLITRAAEGISLGANDGNNIKNTYAYYETALKKMTELYAQAKQQYEKCNKAMAIAVKADADKISKAYSRVKPNVSQYSTPTVEVFVLNINPMQSKGMLFAVKSDVLNKPGVATLTLSAICCKYNEFGVESKIKARKLKLWSMAAFKALGLISEEAKAVYIVDDGYIDLDKTFAKADCFAEEDNDKIYLSEAAARKFIKFAK